MLDTLRRFMAELAGLPDETARPEATAEGAAQVAVAALLIHLVDADGMVDDRERAILENTLSRHFGLDRETARAVLAEGREQEEESVDFYTFTSHLKRVLDEAGRREVIEMMWEVVYADGHVQELEENIIWRVAELLGVSSRDRVTIRQAIEARRQPA